MKRDQFQRRFRRGLATLLVAASLVGCSTTQTSSRWMRSEVYFGLSKPDGSRVSDGQWEAFLNEEITPRFPAGLSVVDSAGQWRNASGKVEREPSKLLVLIHPPQRSVETQIDEIRRAYCQRFSQEAVMKVTTSAKVAF